MADDENYCVVRIPPRRKGDFPIEAYLDDFTHMRDAQIDRGMTRELLLRKVDIPPVGNVLKILREHKLRCYWGKHNRYNNPETYTKVEVVAVPKDDGRLDDPEFLSQLNSGLEDRAEDYRLKPGDSNRTLKLIPRQGLLCLTPRWLGMKMSPVELTLLTHEEYLQQYPLQEFTQQLENYNYHLEDPIERSSN
jgi:hypothetical protein